MLNRAVAVLVAIAPLACSEQLPVRAYTTTEGLPHNHINRIRQDSGGFLWFATDGGLSRFDGHDITSYTVADGLPHPWVNDFIQARDGTYWVATDAGLVQFNPNGSSARERRPAAASAMFDVIGPPGSTQARRVNALAEDKDGSLLCATYNGLYRLKRAPGRIGFEGIELGTPSGEYEGRLVNNIAASRRGGWWVAARYGLYRLFGDGRVMRYMLANGPPDNFIETVMEDRLGRVWAGTRTHGLCPISEKPAPAVQIIERCYSIADGLPSNDVRTILQTSNGTLWIGTAGGLSEFQPEAGTPFHNYSGASGLTDQHVLKLAEDMDGNLWIGTMYGGVMKMPTEKFITFDERDGFRTAESQWISETLAGELVIAPELGAHPFIQVFDGQRFQSASINVPVRLGELIPLHTGVLQDRSGGWWIGSSRGLFRFPRSVSVRNLPRLQPRALYTRNVGFAGNDIEALFEDASGDLWISSSSVAEHGGLTEWSRKSEAFEAPAEASPVLQHSRIRVFQQDTSGSLWLGLMYGAGLIRRRHGRFEPLQVPEGTFRGDVEAIHFARSGQLWVGTTQGGLVRVESQDSDHPRITRYTEVDGLSSNGVHCITEDQSGRIYAGTDSGVDRLNPATGRIRQFTSADGLERGSILLAWRDRQGALWFVASTGASRLIPAPEINPPAPKVMISGLRIRGIRYRISAVGETEVQGLEVDPGPNDVQVDFDSPDFRLDSGLKYQYKLAGAYETWSVASTERTVRYVNLSPGVYRFLVRAVTSDGVGSVQPANISFRVLEPFWRRWWFMLLSVCAMAPIGYGLHRYRTAYLVQLERVRTRIAADLHDDIGASLSQIVVASEVLNRRDMVEEEFRETLSQIAKDSRELVASISDLVWSIDPRRDYLRDLMQRMRRFASDMFTAHNIQFQFNAPGGDLQLNADQRRHIFLIFKEAVNNIVRHSDCTAAGIRLDLQRNSLVLEIRDNGRGLETSMVNGGTGLSDMRWRAEALGGAIEVQGENGRGTNIILRVPLGRVPGSPNGSFFHLHRG